MLTFAVRILLVIPARIGSTRLPEKPLCRLAGEPLIRHTARQALGYPIEGEVLVATDDERILDAVAPLGVRAVMTDASHASGTERVAEVVRRPEFSDAEIIVNLQGDEPFLPASAVEAAVRMVSLGASLVTVAHRMDDTASSDPNRVKVLVDAEGRASWFWRNAEAAPVIPSGCRVFQHVGLYAYTKEALLHWVGCPPTTEELRDGLEQLRPLAHGRVMRAVVTDLPMPPAIDTEEDLRRLESHLMANSG